MHPNCLASPLNDLISITGYGIRGPDRINVDRIAGQRISGNKPRLSCPGSRQNVDHSTFKDVVTERRRCRQDQRPGCSTLSRPKSQGCKPRANACRNRIQKQIKTTTINPISQYRHPGRSHFILEQFTHASGGHDRRQRLMPYCQNARRRKAESSLIGKGTISASHGRRRDGPYSITDFLKGVRGPIVHRSTVVQDTREGSPLVNRRRSIVRDLEMAPHVYLTTGSAIHIHN